MHRQQAGLVLPEVALVGGLFFMVLFAVIETGRLLFTWNALIEATRRGARIAAVCPINHSGIRRLTVFADPASGASDSPVLPNLTTADVSVAYLDDDGAVIADTVANYGMIRFVRVRINNYQHQFLVPFLYRTLNAPDFSTTLPRESLGLWPDGTTVCYGTLG